VEEGLSRRLRFFREKDLRSFPSPLNMPPMSTILTFRGREITEEDAAFIRELMVRHPEASRKKLSQILCQAWGWVQPNGQLKEMVCRTMLLELHRRGVIELPPRRGKSPNPLSRRRKPEPVEVDTTPIEGTLSSLQPLSFRQVRRTQEEKLFNGLIEQYHYLGYVQPVGEHLKFLVKERGGRPVACMAWASPPYQLGPRDRYVGWSREARKRNLHLLAYNTRYLILPWVRVPNLASHILGWMSRELPAEWEKIYAHPVVFLETFINPKTHKGTCYLAANWKVLGKTQGRGGKSAPNQKNRVPVKEILGLALRKDFREILGREG